MFHILVVEDDTNTRKLTCDVLSDNGYTPVSWVITGTAVTVAYFIIRRKELAQIGKRRADII